MSLYVVKVVNRPASRSIELVVEALDMQAVRSKFDETFLPELGLEIEEVELIRDWTPVKRFDKTFYVKRRKM